MIIHSPRLSLTLVGSATACLLALAYPAATATAATLADWTFETSAPTTAGPFAPEINNTTGTTPAATINTGGTVSSPAGNGSAHSFSSNTWTTGKYFQFTLSTAGFGTPSASVTGIGVSYDQAGSSTGPKDFALSYSTDGGVTFTPTASNTYAVAVSTFSSSGGVNPAFTHTFDLSSDMSLDNNTTNSIIFRIVDLDTTAINGTTVAPTGTDRVDNFTVYEVPEPTTVLGGALMLGAAGWSQRRRLRAMISA